MNNIFEEAETTTDLYRQLELAKDNRELVLTSLAQNNYLTLEVQKILATKSEEITWYLIQNPYLFPELFDKLFLIHKDFILYEVQKYNFTYNNSETQSLLEKYSLSV